MIVVLKNKILICVLICVIIGCTITPIAIWAAAEQGKKVIVIDAGHGGYDGGVIGVNSKIKESTINLDIALMLGEYLKSDGYKIVYTRKDDRALGDNKQSDMKKRIQLINSSNCILMVSIHINFYPSKYRRGIQTFYNKGIDEEFAQHMQNHLNSSMNVPTINRKFSALFGDYYILANSNCPACIVECGFVSNPYDENMLLTKDYRMLLAYNIFCGIKGYTQSQSHS